MNPVNNMTLRELLHVVMDTGNLYKVCDIIYDKYYNQEWSEKEHDKDEVRDSYTKVVRELLELPECKPVDNTFNDVYKICIREAIDDLDPENIIKYIDVCLYLPKDEETYAIDTMSWAKLIDMYLDDTVGLPSREIVAHILWEITFYGFTNKALGEARHRLEELSRRIDSGEEKLIPWDDVKKELEEKNDTEE